MNDIQKKSLEQWQEERFDKAMHDEVGNMLVEQLSHELYNHNLYITFSDYYKVCGLHKLSKYFKERAEEELVHQKWIYNRLTQCDFPFKYPEVKIVTNELNNHLDPLEQTVKAEIETTYLINKIALKALEYGDMTTVMWLYEFLLKEQHEEEYVSRQAYKLGCDEETDWQTKQDSIIEFYEQYKEV